MFEELKVEVAYATEERQIIIEVIINQGATIADVISQSGLLTQFPLLNLNILNVGIFSLLQSLDYVVQNGDRIEIYRPLANDPKEIRRQRAEISPIKKNQR